MGAFVLRRTVARRRADRVLREGRAELERVARTRLSEPAAEVVAEHRRVRELVALATVR